MKAPDPTDLGNGFGVWWEPATEMLVVRSGVSAILLSKAQAARLSVYLRTPTREDALGLGGAYVDVPGAALQVFKGTAAYWVGTTLVVSPGFGGVALPGPAANGLRRALLGLEATADLLGAPS